MVDRIGGAGNDNFVAVIGEDENFFGGNGSDRVEYTTNVVINIDDALSNEGEALGDTYNSIERFLLSAGSSGNGNEYYGGSARDTVIARSGDDILSGGGGNDNLRGNGGDDILIGGIGSDRLSGGTGNDRFELTLGDEAGDIIDGFTGIDTIALIEYGTFNLDALLSSFTATNIEQYELLSSGGVNVELSGLAQLQQITVASGASDQANFSSDVDLLLSDLQAAAFTGFEGINFTNTRGEIFEVSSDGVQLIVDEDTSTTSTAVDSYLNTYDLTTLIVQSREISYSNGVVAEATFDQDRDMDGNPDLDGLLDLRVLTDVDDVKNYSTSTTSYDSAGVRESTVTIYDKGRFSGDTETKSFNAAGQLEQKVVFDAGSDKAYTSITTDYDTMSGKFTQIITLNDDGSAKIQGGSQDNVLTAQSSNADVFIGALGNDTFVFGGGNIGTDQINDFDVANEQLDLTAYGISTGSEEFLTITQNGSNTLLTIDDVDGSIKLRNVDSELLTDANFVDFPFVDEVFAT